MAKETLENDIRNPESTVVESEHTTHGLLYTACYQSQELQPNGLPRFSAGISGFNKRKVEAELLSTIKTTGATYNEDTKKMSWQ